MNLGRNYLVLQKLGSLAQVSIFRSKEKPQGRASFLVSPFWLRLWGMSLACAWLLPNHYLPWASFHGDAWISVILCLSACGVTLGSTTFVRWHWITLLTAALALLPIIQYLFGVLPFAGQAWISTIFLIGLLLALLVGARWESIAPRELIHGLFFAITIASVLSVALQLYQWLGVEGLEFSAMGFKGGRPYANFGQPNLLGTLLLWGLIACTWGVVSGKISASISTLLALFLLTGIALTQSRTAWLGLFLLLCATWAWRRLWPTKWFPWAISALGIYFVLFNFMMPYISDMWHATEIIDPQARLNTELRPTAWRLFVDASLQRPWFGYGWTTVKEAQLTAAIAHPSLGITFGHAHNLFLDLVLWCGIPIGLMVSASLIYWFFTSIRRINNIQDALLLMFLAIVGNHAMLELPLHYAYFLLPAGLVMGVLHTRLGYQTICITPRFVLLGIWIIGAALLAFTVRDYLHVEDNYYALRFERARIGTLPPRSPPDVVLLTQLREELRFARFEPKESLSTGELDWMRRAAQMSPGPQELYKLASALAMNSHPDEAQVTLRKLCKIAPVEQCSLVMKVWELRSAQDPKFAAVPWPN
jgi:O-antigen ligase